MEAELERFHKQNTQLELNITELWQKLRATDQEMHKERQKVRGFSESGRSWLQNLAPVCNGQLASERQRQPIAKIRSHFNSLLTCSQPCLVSGPCRSTWLHPSETTMTLGEVLKVGGGGGLASVLRMPAAFWLAWHEEGEAQRGHL